MSAALEPQQTNLTIIEDDCCIGPRSEKGVEGVVIVKTVDAKTRSKTSINDLLRD